MWLFKPKVEKKIEKPLKIALKLSKSPYFFHFWGEKSFLNQTTYVLKKSVLATIFLKSRFFLKLDFLKSRFHYTTNSTNFLKLLFAFHYFNQICMSIYRFLFLRMISLCEQIVHRLLLVNFVYE